jgi:hypothetical protein
MLQVSYECCKSRLRYCICCKYFRGILQAFVQNVYLFQTYVASIFYLNIAYVSFFIRCCICSHICCKSMFEMFQLFQSYVAISVFILQDASVLSGCYICVHIHVASVYSKCFICFKCMLHPSVSCSRGRVMEHDLGAGMGRGKPWDDG